MYCRLVSARLRREGATTFIKMSPKVSKLLERNEEFFIPIKKV